MIDVMEVTMSDERASGVTDDQGNDEPVVPTDAPQPVEMVPVSLLEEAHAEIDRLRAQLARAERAPRGRGQGNFVSARVHRHEDQRDAAAIERWERETGETWTPEPVDHVDPAIQEAADAEKVG